MYQGRPFFGHVHSTDAHLGVVIPLYESGSGAAYTLQSDEYLEIYTVHMVTAAGGDCSINIGDGASATDVDELVIRGTYAANGGVSQILLPPFAGQTAALPYIIAPAGVVDVHIYGTIRQAGDLTSRPGWRQSDFGQ